MKDKHIKNFGEFNENLNSELSKETSSSISNVISSKLSKLKCLKNGHIWSDDETRPHIWRKTSGWYSIGGFPEEEERKCVVCGKTEQR